MSSSRLKATERAVRAATMRVLARVLPRARHGVPDWDARPHRVLLIRPDRIGDQIFTTGVIRAIALRHPAIAIDVLASPSSAPVLENNPHVRRVLVYDRKRKRGLAALWRELRSARYDAAIDVKTRSPSLSNLLLLLASRAPYRIGAGGRQNDFIYSLPVTIEEARSSYVDQIAALAEPFGIAWEGTDWRPELFLTDAELHAGDARWTEREPAGRRPLRLLVNVSAYTREKEWPLECYTTVLRALMTATPGPHIIVLAAPGREETTERFARDIGVECVRTPRLRDAFGLIASADLVFTPDTGIAHIAAALDVPTVVMILERFVLFAPYAAEGRVVRCAAPTLAGLELGPVRDALWSELARVAAERAARGIV